MASTASRTVSTRLKAEVLIVEVDNERLQSYCVERLKVEVVIAEVDGERLKSNYVDEAEC